MRNSRESGSLRTRPPSDMGRNGSGSSEVSGEAYHSARTRPMSERIPPLSVVMPARNALPYLDASIESMLGQSFGDFEFVIRDDGSSDGTAEALRGWAARDRRIRLFEGERLGLAGSSNFVVQQARAPLVARMDADDLARPDRVAGAMKV